MVSIAIQNIKGGVGKSTSSIHLAAGIVRKNPNARVLLIDFDSQASLRSYYRLKLNEHQGDSFDFLVNGHPYKECVVRIIEDSELNIGFDVMLGSRRLADADIRMSTFPRREETLQFRFDEQKIEESYSHIIFDCPPTLNLVTYNVLTVADYLVIPTEMDHLSMTGIQTILENMNIVEKYFNRSPKLLGILPTKFDQRLSMTNEIMKVLQRSIGVKTKILQPIRLDVKIKNCQARKKTVYQYAPTARASEDYLTFTDNVLAAIEGREIITQPEIYKKPTIQRKRVKTVEADL
ncbi:MAG: ParA family protein [Bdellovibrionia bacterium]